jgi:uncharacterized membrane protein
VPRLNNLVKREDKILRKLLLVISVLFSCLAFCSAKAENRATHNLQKVAKVLEVQEKSSGEFREQLVKLEFENEGKKEQIFLTNIVPDYQPYSIIAKSNQYYLLGSDDSSDEVYIADYYREPVVYTLMFVFFSLIILFGRMHGLKALLSLALTGVAIIYFMIPGIKNGYNPILLAVLVSAFATGVTVFLIAGYTRKALAATIGTTMGVSIAGIIAIIAIKLAPLSGLANADAQILLANIGDQKLDFQGLLAAGVIIASLGAAMDVTVSIASATQEVYEANPAQSKRELFAHAVTIGRDIMGTMTDTLLLAYTGASLPLFLLLYNESGLRLLNMEIIATELSSALIGSIGLVLAIPITAITAVFLLKGLDQLKGVSVEKE